MSSFGIRNNAFLFAQFFSWIRAAAGDCFILLLEEDCCLNGLLNREREGGSDSVKRTVLHGWGVWWSIWGHFPPLRRKSAMRFIKAHTLPPAPPPNNPWAKYGNKWKSWRKKKRKKKREDLGGRAEIQQYEFLLFDFVNCLFLASTPIKNKNLRKYFFI